VDPLVGGHGVGRIGVGVVGRSPLGALHEGQHEDRAEAASEDAQDPGAQVGADRSPHALTEEVSPVLLVTPLRLGEGEEDRLLFAAAATSQVSVDSTLGPLVGEVASPATEVGG
jgi:hypothetical protein